MRYLPSWVPIHTVPAVSPDTKQHKKERRCSRWTTTTEDRKCSRCSSCSSCSGIWQHWPTGGTAQMQRAGAVGGRLNWSSTVLDRAGSITVILLLQAGPETTHTEHWDRRTDMESGKTSGVKLQLLNGLTVLSPETSGGTATAQFSYRKQKNSEITVTLISRPTAWCHGGQCVSPLQ